MKVTNHEILRPKINNIESIENDTLYQRIKNDPTTNSAIQCLTELLQRQEKLPCPQKKLLYHKIRFHLHPKSLQTVL